MNLVFDKIQHLVYVLRYKIIGTILLPIFTDLFPGFQKIKKKWASNFILDFPILFPPKNNVCYK